MHSRSRRSKGYLFHFLRFVLRFGFGNEVVDSDFLRDGHELIDYAKSKLKCKPVHELIDYRHRGFLFCLSEPRPHTKAAPLSLLDFHVNLVRFRILLDHQYLHQPPFSKQVNNLQWTLASVPCVKALQLAFSFFFWYSCFYFQTCSLWMSFGVYVTGLLFETTSIVSFLLIAHGYSITSERLSIPERRAMAILGCVFYLILVGHRASIPYFSILLVLDYLLIFFVIFNHITQNLSLLREQLNFIEDEDVQEMHDAVYTKYLMFKKFKGAMNIVVIAKTADFFRFVVDPTSNIDYCNNWL
ncbi:hypothetical protein L2E82_09217 [Cichorium intybus]|uniref:Uncharacterized protein n=1 Tax=Cichorium intybus TaxID=13427 RepID=A0ACB9G8F1_CICIN|nr:hypothetical protein L2E82_09217 [Cichorium intybus]